MTPRRQLASRVKTFLDKLDELLRDSARVGIIVRRPMSADTSTAGFVVRLLESDLIGSAIECVTAVWESDNTIARALGVTRDEYRTAATLTCEQAAQDGLGLVLWDEHSASVVGFVFSLDLVDELDVERAKALNGTPNMRIWGEFLSSALAHYVDQYHGDDSLPLQRGQVLYMNIGGVRHDLTGRGFVRLMVCLSIHEFAVGHGYSRILGIATHRKSVGFVRKPPMQVVAEIEFASQTDPRLQGITALPAAVVGSALLTEPVRTTYARAAEGHAECLEPHRRWRPRA